MLKPVLLVVDDEPEDQQAIEHDLRVKYSQQFGIVITNAGHEALEILK